MPLLPNGPLPNTLCPPPPSARSDLKAQAEADLAAAAKEGKAQWVSTNDALIARLWQVGGCSVLPVLRPCCLLPHRHNLFPVWAAGWMDGRTCAS